MANAVERKFSHSGRLKTGKLNRKQYPMNYISKSEEMENKDVFFSPHHQGSSLARRTAKNSFYSLAGFLWPVFLLFFRIPYFIHKLGTEQYGIWVLVISTVGMMGFLNLGIGNSLVKFISEYHAKNDLCTVNNIVGNSFFIYSMISITVVPVGFFVLPHFVKFIGIKEPYKEVVVGCPEDCGFCVCDQLAYDERTCHFSSPSAA